MKISTHINTLLICAFGGVLLFAYHQHWIIFSYPSYNAKIEQQNATSHITKKNVNLIFWHNEKWNSEYIELIWSDDIAHNLHYLINSWLTLLDEEHVMNKKVTLQSALLSSSGQEAYASFDRKPFNKEASTFGKWMWIEGLLKTIRDNGIQLQKINFLVHHQPLHDNHLDFSNPWPIAGFLEQ